MTTPHAPTDEKKVEGLMGIICSMGWLTRWTGKRIARWHLSQMQENDKEIEGLRTLREDLKGQVLDLRAQLASKELEIEALKKSEYQMQLARLMVNNHELKQQLASLQEAVKVKDEALRRIRQINDHEIRIENIAKQALNAGKEGDEKCQTDIHLAATADIASESAGEVAVVSNAPKATEQVGATSPPKPEVCCEKWKAWRIHVIKLCEKDSLDMPTNCLWCGSKLREVCGSQLKKEGE